MSKVISDLTGTNTTLTDEEWFATNDTATPDTVFAFGVSRLKLQRLAIQGRTLTWTPGGWLIDGSAEGLAELERQANWAHRLQVGYTRFGTDTASFTGEISGTTLTTSAQTGYLYDGVFIAGTGVTGGTYIVRQLTGNPRQAGAYEVSASQTVSSAAMSSSGYHEGQWIHGDGVGLYKENADGSPSGIEDADNILDAANDAARYTRAIWAQWNVFYEALTAAKNTVGFDQNKIDAMRLVIDSFDDPGSWPATSLPI